MPTLEILIATGSLFCAMQFYHLSLITSLPIFDYIHMNYNIVMLNLMFFVFALLISLNAQAMH